MKLYCVIGLGQFGRAMASTLAAQGAEVMVIDQDEGRLQAVKDEVAHAIRADARDREALRAVGVEDADTAVVALGEAFEASVLVTAHLRKLGVAYILTRASSPIQGEILTEVGANRVVYPEAQMAQQVARALVSHAILDVLKVGEDLNLAEVRPPQPWVGRTLSELDLRATHGLNVIVIRRERSYVDASGETMTRRKDLMPVPEETVRGDDVLVVVGNDAALAEVAEVGR